jgi:hypothetical protein
VARVTSFRTLESCLDTAPVVEFELDCAVTEDLMRLLARGSHLQYFPHFPRPLFRIDAPGLGTIQGIIGNTTLRVTLVRTAGEDVRETVECLIES